MKCNELKIASLFEFEKVLKGSSHKLFYAKSEADSYIAYLKYKRCLVMAKFVKNERAYFNSIVNDIYTDFELKDKYRRRVRRYGRWHEYLLSLADKYKEKV